MEVTIRTANHEDTKNLVSFLQKANISTEGVAETIDSFLIMEDNGGQIKATIGIEPLGNIGLLRSLVMTANTNENNLFQLLEQTFLLARDKGMAELYLATNKLGAMKFVQLLGFQQIEKELLPIILCQSEHVKHILTVDNSVFLKLSL
jgi:N-acetylglutamate synthase-like GNAT family acetyltransferase